MYFSFSEFRPVSVLKLTRINYHKDAEYSFQMPRAVLCHFSHAYFMPKGAYFMPITIFKVLSHAPLTNKSGYLDTYHRTA